jgi:hypothetical protein
MPVELLTYATLADRLKCSPEAARSLAKRLRLPRQRGNDGKARISVDMAEITHTPMTGRSPSGHQSGVAGLKAKIEALQTELARLETAAAGHRADYERERDRADQLMTEFLKATADLMAARETAARIEGELAASRGPAIAAPSGQIVRFLNGTAQTPHNLSAETASSRRRKSRI